jgi:hypothetical protein
MSAKRIDNGRLCSRRSADWRDMPPAGPKESVGRDTAM